MATDWLTEGNHAGHFIVSEANGNRSRIVGTYAGATALTAGQVVTFTVSSGAVSLPSTPADANAILFDNTEAGDVTAVKVVVLSRDCEVNAAELDFGTMDAGEQLTAMNALATAGIICREAQGQEEAQIVIT